MDLPPRVDSGVLIRLADREAPVLGRTIVPGPRRPLSSRPLGRDAAASHGASIFSFPGQNPDSRRQGGRPAQAPGPCAARAEDSLCGALRVPEAVRYEGHSELRRTVGANTAGLPHGHAPPRALVAAPGPEPTCVKSFHLTHIVREVTRLASHRTAGGGFPLKTTAAFEQAPEGTFFAFTEVKTITVKQLAECPKLKKKKRGKNLTSTQGKKKPPSSAWYRSSAEPREWKEEEVLAEALFSSVVCLLGAAVPCPCPRLLPSAAKPVQKWLQGHMDHAEFAPEASGWAVPRGHREVPRWPGSRSRLAERGCVRNARALKRSLIIRDQTRRSRGGHARARLPTRGCPRPAVGTGRRRPGSPRLGE